MACGWGVFLGVIVLAACVTPYGYRAMWVTVRKRRAAALHPGVAAASLRLDRRGGARDAPPSPRGSRTPSGGEPVPDRRRCAARLHDVEARTLSDPLCRRGA